MNIFLIGSITDVITNLSTYSEALLNNLGIWGALISCLLIITESMLPFCHYAFL